MIWLWLLFALTIVTLVGHGIWALVAFTLRALFGAHEPETKTACPHCGRQTSARRGQCDWCGRSQHVAASKEIDDLAAVERQLERWRLGGQLRPGEVDRLTARVQAYRQSLALDLPQLQLEKEQIGRALRASPTVKEPEPVTAELVEAVAASAIEPRISIGAPQRAADPPLHRVDEPAASIDGAAPGVTRPIAPQPVPVPKPVVPRRSPAEMLSTFMEERNIRWGELVGGLLIVCSSVALVISLWETLKTIPYFQFFIFVGVSAALFGVGLYTEHRWKLASTSRGILIISMLLVPLNFVAMAGTAREQWDMPAALTQLAALAIFTVLIRQAGQVLVERWRNWLTLAVIGGSGMLLAVPHQPALAWALILAVPAVALAALSVGRSALDLARRERVIADDVNRLFILLGSVLFTVAVALGLIIARSADRPAALNVLAPLVAVTGVLVAVCGLLVMRAMDKQSDAALRTAGTAVGLFGTAVMLAASAMAWPLPAAIIAVALFDFTVLAVFAVRYRLPALHAVAIACLALAYVTAAHVTLGNLTAMQRAETSLTVLRLFASAQTGTTLVGLFLALAVAAEVFSRRGRASDAVVYVGGCAAVAAVSLSLVAVRGYLAGHADAWRAAVVFATYGLGSLALNVRWRRPAATHGGAALVGGALIYAIVFTETMSVPYRWIVIALVQATWTIVASIVVGFRREAARGDSLAGAIVGPLRQWGIAASLVAAAVFCWIDWQRPLVLAIDLGWLAALWLLLAIAENSPRWFAAFQAAVYAATAFAITSWLNDQAWVAHDPRGLLHPRSLQIYGIGWGLLSLLWTMCRAALRDRPVLASAGRSAFARVDRVVIYLLIVASFAIALGGALPGVVAEFSGSQLTAVGRISVALLQAHAFEVLGWALAGVLAAGVFTALWERWGKAELIGGVLLLVNAALLIAGPAAAGWATASALRWSLAAAFLIGSLPVWLRAPLARIASRLKCRIEPGAHAAALAAGLLIALAAAPVVCLSGLVAAMRIVGEAPAGPLSGIWLADVGLSVSHLVPLALVVVGLVGYAVREGSPGYAFAAGAVANLTVTGGYALNLPQFGATQAAQLVQLATITAAVWLIGWLAARRRVLSIFGQTESPAAWPLLRLQGAQSALGNLLLLLSAFGLLAVASPLGAGGVHDWIAAAGSPMGWLTLALAYAAAGLGTRLRGRPLRPEIMGLVGMAVLGLAACSVEAMMPGTPWAYRTMMLGWATYALSVVAATWWATAVYAPAEAEGPPAALVRAAAVWVRVSGLLALVLGLKTVALGGPDANEPLWGAAAIGIASAAAAAMAVWQRREGWAFTAGLGVNLAATIVVWHRLAVENRDVAAEWVWLLQANLIAAAVVALLWLAARRRMYAGRDLSIGASPFLTMQTSLIALGNLILQGFALAEIIVSPDSTSDALRQYGASAGWFAWLLGSAAIGIHLYHVARRELVHAIAASFLGIGVLAAVATSQADIAWQAYHSLIIAWSTAAFGLLTAGWLAGNDSAAESSPSTAVVWRWLKLLAPAREVEIWLTAFELALAALAVRGAADDPMRPWWPMAAALSACVLAAGQAIWRRKPQHVYLCGLLANLAASIFWYAQPSATLADLLSINAVALAVNGIFWSLVSRWMGTMEPLSHRAILQGRPDNLEPGTDDLGRSSHDGKGLPPFEHAAAAVSVALIATVAWLAWCSSWLTGELPSTVPQLVFDVRLAWAAWASVAAGLAVALGDRRATFCPAGFYATGLAAVALVLAQLGQTGHDLLWTTGPALAGWVLAAALVHALSSGTRQAKDGASHRWFNMAQSAVGICAVLLSVWIALAFDAARDRAAGGASSMLLSCAVVCMLRGASGKRQAFWQTVLLVLAVIAPAEWMWAFCDGETQAILWIHRSVALLVSLAVSIVGCEFLAPLVLTAGLSSNADDRSRSESPQSAWAQSFAGFRPAAIGLALCVLAIVLVQQRWQYIPREGVPTALAAKLAVLTTQIGLILLALMYAVVAHRDPLRLSPRGRAAYVYAAEVLAVLVWFHIRTTMPKLIPFGTIENWWTLIVMIVAFCGAGLAELFERRRLCVLSEPLIRTALFAPLLPAAGPLAALVWLPDEHHRWLVEARMFSNEAVLFLVAVFYGIQAALKRSLLLATLAAASVNAGLWLLWHRLHWEFLVHPQLWLIPPALAALVAEYLNRERLKPEQSGAVRYLALATIYVASTADVFISHVDRHISLPLVLVLLGLSLAGVLSGMLLRVRSFLYLGFTFLLVDLSVMVYHAAWDLGHTWVFYGTGIVVGLAILALFGVFEKRRNDVVLALERFKEWR